MKVYSIIFVSLFVVSCLSQQCSDFPGCVDCEYLPNSFRYTCKKYRCNTYACGECTNNICTGCEQGFAINNEKCNQCSLEGCSECPYKETKQNCLSCFTGYIYRKEAQICEDCHKFMSGCSACENDSNGNAVCTACDYSYALNGDNVCQLCPTGATDCKWNGNKMIALQCGDSSEDPYYLDPTSQECKLCQGNCDYCQVGKTKSGTICQQCNFWNNNGFVNQDGDCQEGTSISPNCVEGKLVNGKYVCTGCNNIYGYYLNDKTKNCDKLSCADLTENCWICGYQQNFDNSTKQIKECQFCEKGYYQDQNGKCLKCSVDNCESCIISNSTCYQCNNGYYYKTETNECVPLNDQIPNCLYGNYTNGQVQCSACYGGDVGESSYIYANPGYYLNSDYTKCLPCVDNCNECSVINGTLQCQLCSARYILQTNNEGPYCKKIPIDNCDIADTYGPSSFQCLQCSKGYYGINGICKKIESTETITLTNFLRGSFNN